MAARMASWVLRVKAPSGNYKISDLNGDSTVQELTNAVHSLTGIPPSVLNAKYSYPPMALTLDDKSLSLSSVGLHHGDTVMVSAGQIREQCTSPEPTHSQSEGRSGTGHDSVEPTSGEAENAVAAPSAMPVKGVLVRRVVPADNSCLFVALSILLLRDPLGGTELRHLIATRIRESPEEYGMLLDKPPAEYCEWIVNPNHWGGAIDIHILSQHFEIEVHVFDIQTLRVDPFGTGSGYTQRVLLIYDGVHYDPLGLSAYEGAPSTMDVTVFPVTDTAVLTAAHKLTAEAHKKLDFTDLANFKIRCGVCQTPLVGQREAQSHARATGHTNFAELKGL